MIKSNSFQDFDCCFISSVFDASENDKNETMIIFNLENTFDNQKIDENGNADPDEESI